MTRSVYIISAGDNPVKVGIADDVTARLRQLQTGNPDDLIVHHAIAFPGSLAEIVEAEAHRALHQFHRRGEWFNVSVAMAKATIDRVSAPLMAANSNRAEAVDPFSAILRDLGPDSWAREALGFYRANQYAAGREALAAAMNQTIAAAIGHTHLVGFQAAARSPVSAMLVFRDGSRGHRRMVDALRDGLVALSRWYAAYREQQLLDEIHGIGP